MVDCGADDRARTGDLDLGKVALYQLSYVRVNVHNSPPVMINQPASRSAAHQNRRFIKDVVAQYGEVGHGLCARE